jgi:hypothetical protein
LSPSDIVVFHFNETKYKHIDIIKNPLDENGDNWLDIIRRDKKYDVKKLPILHYKTTVFDKYRAVVEPMMIEAIKKVTSVKPEASLSPDASLSKEGSIKQEASLPKEGSIKQDDSLPKEDSLPKDEIRKASPIASLTNDEIQPMSPIATTNASSKSTASLTPVASLTKDNKPKKTKCPKGTRKNRKTGVCEPKGLSPTPSLSSSLAAEPLVAQQLAAKLMERNLSTAKLTDAKLMEAPLQDTIKPKKCPKGTRKNRRTGICEPNK